MGNTPGDSMTRQRVLIIDDSKPIHALVRARLANEPIELLHADSGTVGLDLAKRHLPDLILLDVDMPSPDGFEVCRQLKADPSTREVPIIFLTGASSTEQKLQGLELGAVDYITKPFDPAELRARVKASLRTKHLLDLVSEKAAVLQASEERYRFLAENSSDIISRHGVSGEFLYVSPACEALLGYEPDYLSGRHPKDIVHPEDVTAVAELFSPRLTDETAAVTFRARRKDGRFVWLEATTRAIRHTETGDLLGIHMTSRDVTQRKQQEVLEQGRGRVLEMIAANQALPEILPELVRMVESEYPTAYGSAVLLTDGRLEHAAPNLPDGFRMALEGRLLRLAAEICHDPAYENEIVVCIDIATNEHWVGLQEEAAKYGLKTCWSLLIRSSSGEVAGMFALYLHESSRPDRQAQALLEMVGKLITIASEHRELTYQLAYRAQHDSLTGLPNRLLFEDRLNQGLGRASRNGQLLALFCIDLDRFKYVNDTLGHHAGDLLLVEFARRVQEVMRLTDTLARMGGDEFTMILPDLKQRSDALLVAQKVMDVLKPPFEVAGEELFVTGSIGIAVYPNDGDDAQTLQKHADMALYRAKAQGRNGYQCFSQEMLAAVSERLALEGQLRRALEHGEFELRYQPQFDREMTLVGFEALLRWRHPKLGEVPPTKFIPLAEETGLILGIGDWVLDEACRQNRAWQRAGHPPIKVAVNVSAMQFAQPGFAESVARVLERNGLAPQWLELEITESLLMKNTQESSKKLEDIRRMGISVALDDFGTGYSSLAYLQHLPIDTLKIDRSFVQRIHDGAAPSNEVAVIRAILSMGHNLGMHVVAEGVESKFQFDFLRRHGCNGIQGFLFGKPRPASEAVRFFQHTSKPIVAPGNLPLSA